MMLHTQAGLISLIWSENYFSSQRPPQVRLSPPQNDTPKTFFNVHGDLLLQDNKRHRVARWWLIHSIRYCLGIGNTASPNREQSRPPSSFKEKIHGSSEEKWPALGKWWITQILSLWLSGYVLEETAEVLKASLLGEGEKTTWKVLIKFYFLIRSSP